MPAPTPISVRYGNPLLLGQAAAAAGTGSYNLDQNRINAANYERRRASDQDMIAQILAQKAEERMRNNELRFRYDAMNAQAAMPQEMASGRALQTAVRSGAQKNAAITTATGRANNSLIIPVPGSQPEGSMEMRGRGGNSGERYYSQDGGIRKEISDPNSGRVFLDQEMGRTRIPTDIPPGTSPDMQAKLQSVAAMQGTLPPDDFNRLWVAAQTPGYTGAQLQDDINAAKQKTGRAPIEQSTIDSAGRSEYSMSAIEGIPDSNVQMSAKRDFLSMTDEDTYGPEEIATAWNARRARNQAVMRPIQNSGGKSLTGGNVARINSDEEFDVLPPGAYYVGPDGVTRRK